MIGFDRTGSTMGRLRGGTRTSRSTQILWFVAVGFLSAHLATQFLAPVMPGDPWQLQGKLTDFRDTVWVPGRFLLGGGNPYDTAAVLAEHPWTQGLRVYAPAWLVLTLPVAPLPYLVGAFFYQLLGIAVVTILIRTVLSLTLPRFLSVGTPVGLVWCTLWAPGRFALENVSSGLVILGTVLVLRGVWLRRSAEGAAHDVAPPSVRLTAVGVALSLIKPQFGLFVLAVAVVGRRQDAAWRGVLGMAILSTPIAAVCVYAAGGLREFLDSIRTNVAISSSPDATTGLLSEFNVRIDLVGQLARLGFELPPWSELAVAAGSLLVGAFIVVRSRTLFTLSAGVVCALLLGAVHEFYDLVLLFLPLCAGIGWWLERRRDTGTNQLIHTAMVALPTVHVHRVSTSVVPGLGMAGADLIDTVLLAVALAVSCVRAAVRSEGVTHGHADDTTRTAPRDP